MDTGVLKNTQEGICFQGYHTCQAVQVQIDLNGTLFVLRQV